MNDTDRVNWLERKQADVFRHNNGWRVRVWSDEVLDYSYDNWRSAAAGFEPVLDWRAAVDEAINAHTEAECGENPDG